MSTRCQIKVIANGKELMLYHHCDGYPEGVGMCLLKLMERYKDGKQYRSDADDLLNLMITKGDFEITFANHGDIEFLYEMNFDKKTVTCHSVDNWDGDMKYLSEYKLEYSFEKDCMVDEAIFE